MIVFVLLVSLSSLDFVELVIGYSPTPVPPFVPSRRAPLVVEVFGFVSVIIGEGFLGCSLSCQL